MKRLLLASVFALVSHAALADLTIDALSAATTLDGTEAVPIFQTANPAVRTTPSAIRVYIAGTASTWSAAQTYAPADAGAGLTSAALNFTPPARLGGATTTLGFGTGLDTPALQVINTGPQNTFTITNTNTNGIAAVSFRGVDRSYTNTSTVFEHGAIGWLPSFGSGANTGVTFWEGSRFDKALNPLIPPPDMQIQQTGGIDPTGGTSQSCSITATLTAITCVGNLAANGSLITGNGTDIPPATTLVSGAGTTSGVMSAAAGSTNATDTLNFSNPTYAVHTVIDSVPGGNLRIPGWDGSTNILNVDRINNRVGILTTSPGFPLDVNGDARVIGVLRFTNTSGIVSPSNTLHIGDLDSATPAANSIQFQSVLTGTSNTAGGNTRINGALGTGTGSGGALLFQTSPAGTTGTTQNALVQRAAILAAGQVIIGNSSVIRAAENGAGFPIFQIQSNIASAINNGASISSYATSASQPANLYLAQSGSATLGTQTAVANNTLLGQVTNSGSDGTNFQNSSRIIGAVDGTVSAGVVPGRIVFQTASAAGTLTEAMRLDKAQGVTFPGVTTGTNADFACFAAGGVLTLQTTACTISSLRFKDVLGELTPERMVADIMALHPLEFKMKTPATPNADPNYDRPQIGLTAENVAAVDTRLSIFDDDMTTPKSYRQEGVIAALVVTAQTQQREIDTQRIWLIVLTLIVLALGGSQVMLWRRR